MAHDDTAASVPTGTALVVIGPSPTRNPSFARLDARADFLSQMVAARQHLASQRARRQVPVERALDAYAEGSDRATPHLPQGFFRSLSV